MLYSKALSGVPNLSKDSQKLFQQQRESWWSRFTNIDRLSKNQPPFAYRVATDGASVSVLFQRSPAATAIAQADVDLQARHSPATAAVTDKGWVRGPSLPIVTPQRRVVGIDPGAKAVFTGVVHSAVAEQTLSDPCPVRYRSRL